MNKITLLIFLISSSGYSQSKGLVYYGYIESLTQCGAKGYDSNSYMVFNNSQSYYVTAKDSLEKAENINSEKSYLNQNGGGTIKTGMKVSRLGDQIYFDNKTKILYSSLLHGKQAYVKEISDNQNWKIERETKKIGKFNCRKATVSYRGRDYIAWFTQDINATFGPWKFHGLPGLILEVYDKNKYVYWYFKSIEYPSQTKEKVQNIRILKNSKINYLTIKEFKNFCSNSIEEAYEKMIIVSKEFPGVQANRGETKDYFVEVFDNE